MVEQAPSNTVKDSVDVIISIMNQWPEIIAIEVFRPELSPLVQARNMLNADEGKIVDAALRLREQLQMPFWDAIMLSCAAKHESRIVEDLFDAALYHHSSTRGRQRIARGDVTGGTLRSIIDSVSPGEMIAFSSRVHLANGVTKHIPMLDYHIASSASAEGLAIKVASRLKLTGFLLSSGKSYHFYANTLVQDEELVRILARASLFGPIVDRAWIAHQLLEGSCALRISARPEYGGPPRVVMPMK